MVWPVLSTQIKIHTYIKMVKNIPTIERSTKIRFGKHALDNQAENTIVFNASDSAIDAPIPNSIYMTPLRVAEIAGSNLVGYSASTKEVVDSSVPTSLLGGVDLASAIDLGNTSSNTAIFTNTNETIISSGTIRSDNFKTTADEVSIDGNKTNKVQVSGIIHTGDLQATDHVAIANTNPQNKITIGPLGQTVFNVPTGSKFALDTVGNVNAQNYRGDSYYLSNLTMENITNQGNITSNTIIFSNAHNSIFTTSNVDIGGNVFVRNPNDNAIFGNIAGSNTITASKITAGEIIGTTSIEGQNIIASAGGTFQGDGTNITNISAENIDTGILDVDRGGTNIGTYNTGDMLYASGSTTLATITSSGANDKFLKFDSGSGAPAWMDVASTLDEIVGGGPIGSNTTSNVIETGGLVTGFVEATTLEGNGAKISGINAANVVQYNNNTLSDAVLPVVPETKGGTGQSAYAQGDILYSDNANSLNRLAKGTDKQILHMNGNVPQWTTTISDATLNTSILTGSITTQALDANRIPFINGGQVLSTNPKLQFDGDDLVTLGSNVEITGNLHVVGNITARHENSLTINDPIIEVGNNNSSDNIDLGMVMTMSTSNVVHGFRGNEKEYTIAYTHSDPVGPDIVPTLASGITNHPYITANVWGNVLSGNVTTTGKVTTGTFHGDGSSITHLNLGDANNTGQVAIARGGTGVATGLTVLDPANLSSQVLLAKGGTGLTAVSENDLLLGPASGTALAKLTAYTGPTSSSGPAAMSANSSGGNTASSSDSSVNAWKVFDGSDTNYYISDLGGNTLYNSWTPYAYTGSNSLGGINGEWIKIQLASAITPTSVFVKAKPNGTDLSVRPGGWRIMGSNNGTNWTQLHASTTLIDDSSGTTESFSNTTAYLYLAIVVTNISLPGHNDKKWNLSQLLFNYTGSGPTEKFLKSSAAGVSWDEVSSTLQTITDGGATTTQTVAFNNTTTGLTSAGDIDIAASKRIDFATDIIIESTAGTSLNKSPLKIINAIEVDPDVVGGGTSSKNVLAINHTTGEIYDSGGQGGSTMEFIHEEGTGVQANVSIGRTAWGATTDSNLTINTYGSNVLTISGNVSADNITIGALHVSASPFNLDDVASAGAGANVTSNVLQLTATGNAFVTTNNINVSKDVHTGGNVYSQNLQLTNTQISTTWTTGSGTLEIDCKNKTYGTAPAVSIDADVAILNVTNLPSGGQVVVPLVASGADRKVLKTITAGIDFIAFTADVSIDQNSHGLLTVSKIGASGAEKIYMNAISFTAA